MGIVKDRRAKAVLVHEDDAPFFEENYSALNAGRKGRFDSAFLYGRSRVMQLLNEQIDKLPRGASILDVGCGTGEQVRSFREAGFQATGIEPARKMRELAQTRNPEGTVLDGSVLELPFPDGQFDFVLAIEVIRYLDRRDWDQAFSEMLRVLRPGGSMFVTLVNRYALDGFAPFDRIRRALLSLRGREVRAHHDFTTPGEITRDLERLGASEIELHGRMLAPLRLVYKVNERLGKHTAKAVDTLDTALEKASWHRAFAGHLIVVARRPGSDR
jgi:SAM-dependent methyltransferase